MDLIHDFFKNAVFSYRSNPSVYRGGHNDRFLAAVESDRLIIRSEGSTSTVATDVLAFEDIVAVNHGDLTMQITLLEPRRKGCRSKAGRRRRDVYLRREQASNT
ncbi:Sphingosine kinase 2, partial [Perkinsus olseni]